jgi:hypothetical protein
MRLKLILLLLLTLLLPMASHADTWDSWNWATGVTWNSGGGTTPGNDRYFTEDALGEPTQNDNGGVNFLSLGLGGSAVFEFDASFNLASIIIETTWGDPENYKEGADVYVGNSLDTDEFTWITGIDNWSTDGQTEVSLPVSSTYQYLLVVDTTETTYPNSPSTDGFDINAVGVKFAIPNQQTPVPAAVWLLGSGLIGLVCLRKRMTR